MDCFIDHARNEEKHHGVNRAQRHFQGPHPIGSQCSTSQCPVFIVAYIIHVAYTVQQQRRRDTDSRILETEEHGFSSSAFEEAQRETEKQESY